MQTATVTLSLPDGFGVIDEVEFDADACDWTEALSDAGYDRIARANWIECIGNEWRLSVDREVRYIASVTYSAQVAA